MTADLRAPAEAAKAAEDAIDSHVSQPVRDAVWCGEFDRLSYAWRHELASLHAALTPTDVLLLLADRERLDWLEAEIGGSVSAVIAHRFHRLPGLSSLHVRAAIDAATLSGSDANGR